MVWYHETVIHWYLSTGALRKFVWSFGLTLSPMKSCGCMHNTNKWKCKSRCGNGSGSDLHWGRNPLPQRNKFGIPKDKKGWPRRSCRTMIEDEGETVGKTWRAVSAVAGNRALLCGGPVQWSGVRGIDLIWPTGARYEHTMLKTGKLETNYIKQLQPLTPQETLNWMPEHNSTPYDGQRKEKGWDGKSLTACHSHPTLHSRDFTCFGFQRGTSQDLIVQVANWEPLYMNAHMHVCMCTQEQDMEFCQEWYLKITNHLTSLHGLSRLMCRFN